jgi:hypothetical protein
VTNQERVHKANVETVQRMKAQGMSGQTIIDMEPRLQAAVEEVFGQTRHDISEAGNANTDIRIQIAKYAAQHGGGSGAAGPLPSIRDAIL